ncbi:family 43 glycosylhydrolase [Pelagicoccus sp. SDUM812003]|uniref:family 43 glycosylhydrolase n=1 Tax=Pelagicoccus sp. SDUM812003 TaxID=3041267 RepID=UPI00280FCCAF|nr:family 43 glycosylhydrolase [Pelagicoccus sp. SDUM812003]MDQ8203225.1 family 43 glycosylhydrolase [Pelagicoccus sp. SDUM812003]
MIRAFLISFFLMTTLSFASESPFPNPLIPQRADPWVYKHDDGYYYFIATSPQYEQIELRRAKTLEGLMCAEPKVIWEKHEEGVMGAHIWAPELHYIDGKWYVHFAAGEAEEIWKIRMWVLENDSANPLDGQWREKGKINAAWDSFSLDATTFEHQGKRYLIWAQSAPEFDGNSSLFIAEMDTPWSITGKPVLITRPEYEWENRTYKVNEGAAVLKRHGRVFVAYSGSATDHDYAMGLLWADEEADLLDPASWTKSPGPVFVSSEENGIYGPGHNSFTTDEHGNDVIMYHARNYKEIAGPSLRDWNRHARIQRFGWTSDGFPDFGQPAPDTPAKEAPKPLFRDPLYDGTADPVVIWNEDRGRWWMFYTNRRAKAEGLSGVAWVHGTHIGIAESCDLGHSWERFGQANINLPEEIDVADPTHWAPEVMRGPDGTYHMYLTFVPGVFENWGHPRSILHLTSDNLLDWEYQSTLDLSSDRVIDACVARLPDGSWRMWYNNERDGKSIYYADSDDLYNWEDQGKAVGDQAGEGPKVVYWKNSYWMVTDVWDGLGVYRSDDALAWERQEGANLLKEPGSGEDDQVIGGHPDIVLQGDQAFLFYFTHPGRVEPGLPDSYQTRRSSIQVVELKYEDGKLTANRDEPTYLKLDPQFSYPLR